jgi:hypothetical protein
MFVVTYSDGLIDSMLLDKISKFPHFLIHVLFKVKVMKLCQSQLAIVIIETLLGHSHLLSCFLQVHFFLGIVWFGGGEVQVPPMFDEGNNFGDSSLFASIVLI